MNTNTDRTVDISDSEVVFAPMAGLLVASIGSEREAAYQPDRDGRLRRLSSACYTSSPNSRHH